MPTIIDRGASKICRVKTLLAGIIRSERRRTKVCTLVTDKTQAIIAAKAREMDLTPSGLVGIVLESVARGDLFNAVIDLPEQQKVS